MEREDYKSLEDFCSLVRQQKLRTPDRKLGLDICDAVRYTVNYDAMRYKLSKLY